MKQWMIWAVLLVTLLLGSAGYLGFTHTRAPNTTAAMIPPTVAVTRGDVRQTVVAPGKLVGTQEVLLSISVAGQIAAVHVRAGERVTAGQIMAQLDTRSLRRDLANAQAALDAAQQEQARKLTDAELALQIAQLQADAVETISTADLAAAQATLIAAQTQLDTLLAGPDPIGLATAQAELANAEADLRMAQTAYDRVSWRSDIAMLPQAAELEYATNAYNAAKARYDHVNRGHEATQIAAAHAQVQQAEAEYDRLRRRQDTTTAQEEAQLQVAKAQLVVEQLRAGVDPTLKSAVFDAMQKLAAATLTTPFDGVVLAVHVKPGEGIIPGQPILHLADPDAVEVVATVIEEELPLVQVGQQVDLYFDAVPEASVRGRVARIVPQRTSDERPLYPIYIAMDKQPNGLLPGMTADGAIVVDERQDVLQLPRSMLPTRTDGTTEVEIWRDGRAEKRTIRVGLRGDVYAEIVDGLEEGDLVVGQ